MPTLNKISFKYIYFTLIAGLVLAGNDAHATRSAVAVSVSTGRGTISSCKADAPGDALAGCRAQHLKDCRVAAVVTNGFIAIAGVKGAPQTYRAAGARTSREAARSRCQQMWFTQMRGHFKIEFLLHVSFAILAVATFRRTIRRAAVRPELSGISSLRKSILLIRRRRSAQSWPTDARMAVWFQEFRTS